MEELQMISRARQAAELYLKDRVIKRAVIGITMVIVELDDGSVGSSYVLREELAGCTSIFKDNRTLIGMDAGSMADWAVEEKHVLKRALGIATLNCGARAYLTQHHLTDNIDFFDLVKDDDQVAMVGHIGPVIRQLTKRGIAIDVFDKGHTEHEDLKALNEMEASLQKADVVFLSGSTFINGTIDSLLTHCRQTREVILIGSTTIAYKETYLGTPVTLVAGTLWKQDKKDDLFLISSLAGGIRNLSMCIDKFAYRPSK
ncbi:MAG: DUF364 domain-containing protein [Clostridiaceae bacterium]|jgi:uncharacterized protein (DUF4213/DUF364 family)|nr:DUF364 domain-containing protein [Clostridiaceae bacterium]